MERTCNHVGLNQEFIGSRKGTFKVDVFETGFFKIVKMSSQHNFSYEDDLEYTMIYSLHGILW